MEQTIRTFLSERFGGYSDDIQVDETLDSVVDSLGLFELVEFVEQRFAIRIEPDRFDPNRFTSISEIIHLVDEMKSGPQLQG